MPSRNTPRLCFIGFGEAGQAIAGGKIIKPGMDSAQVITRFEAERQALAMMDHPNIARVLDAGQTDAGRPYFVMELVPGLPITEYCDQHQLAIPDPRFDPADKITALLESLVQPAGTPAHHDRTEPARSSIL